MPFKVIKVTDVGTNRKTVCDFLLVINSDWHPILYRFEVIANWVTSPNTGDVTQSIVTLITGDLLFD